MSHFVPHYLLACVRTAYRLIFGPAYCVPFNYTNKMFGHSQEHIWAQMEFTHKMDSKDDYPLAGTGPQDTSIEQ